MDSGAIGIAGLMGGVMFTLIAVLEGSMAPKPRWQYFVAVGLGIACFAATVFARELAAFL